MNKTFLLVALVVGLSACAPSAEVKETPILATATAALSSTPSNTSTPKPSPTITNSPEPTIVPEPFVSNFKDMQLLFEDTFDESASGLASDAWKPVGGLSVTEAGELEIPLNSTVTFVGSDVELNQAIVIRVKADAGSKFFFGLQGLKDGILIGAGHGGYSAYLVDFSDYGFSPRIWRDDDMVVMPLNQGQDTSKWYTVAMGITPDKGFFTKIWDGENVDSGIIELSYFNMDPPFQPDEMADEYRFIICAQAGSTVLLDDFKIVQVGEIVP